MKITLHYKLFGAILTAILAVVIYMSLLMQWSFDRGFLNYVNIVEQEQLKKIASDLESRYREKKSWVELAVNPEEMALLIIASYPEGRQKERFLEKIRHKKMESHSIHSGPLPSDIPSHFFHRVFLLDESRNTVFGYDPGNAHPDTIDIMYQNRVVGYLGVHPAKNLSDIHQLVFIKQQKVALTLVAIGGFLVAAGLSLPIAYLLTQPIRRLAVATRDLASGRYHTRISATSGDELGQLSQDFNGLAEILEKNQQARSQWVADISHELRTPLSILRGQIEALQDGVYPPTAETFRSLHGEVLHLGMLVDDLYQLSLSDVGAMSYHRANVQPCYALQQAIEMLQPELEKKRQLLETTLSIDKEVFLFADNERLKQLFTNLLANSIRYTDEGGRIEVNVTKEENKLIYTILDSAPGVPDEHIPHLFDRLYRVDASRSRDLGGAGLGLSICYNIVKGHNGTIEARQSPIGGLLIRVCLPLQE
ncbi:MAG: HAMP domain-containing protein [Proteobacteria bacterium]|nr:HAMP domain-containing protein [Pseudomonadota bacterium]MBU1419439.1 HAMP domain-containing protein [Pseudomonadota bacterium]MBU1454047.1 HAMP domain-containing protein [Pseudomonadota bacterium]